MSTVYDAGVLIAADRSERTVWAEHRIRLELGLIPIVTAPALSQASRSPRQAQLRRFVRGCEAVDFRADESHPVGELLAEADTSDVVDAHVVLTAAATGATVLTTDPRDLRRLASCLADPIEVRAV